MTELKFNIFTDNEFLLDIFLDSEQISYTLEDNTIILNSDVSMGFHMLTFKLIKGADIRIEAGQVNGVDFRETLYLMFAVSNSDRRQTTILTIKDHTLYLPFAYPMSWWKASCQEKISSQLFASGLYDELSVYYPESVRLPDTFPKLVRDFYEFNMDFYVHPKKLLNDPYYNHEIPYYSLEKKINYDEQALFNEFMSNLDYLKDTARIPVQKTFANNNLQRWWTNDIIISKPQDYSLEAKFSLDKNKLPILYSFLKELNLDVVVHAFIGILGPMECILPHIDDYAAHTFFPTDYKGCSQIYIPINFKPKNYWKHHNVGLLPLDGPILVNNHNFCHSLVNNSNEYRFGIAIVGSPLKI